MSNHPNFAVGDWVRRRDNPEAEPVQVTGYDPVNDLIFWRRDNILGMTPLECFMIGENGGQ